MSSMEIRHVKEVKPEVCTLLRKRGFKLPEEKISETDLNGYMSLVSGQVGVC